jgi:hypothetical protein
MADVGSYREWWPWLRAFDAAGLRTGEEWRCTVRAPLGYSVSFALRFDAVVECERISTTVTGDISGTADLTLHDTPAGCDVVVVSDLAPRSSFLRVLATTVPPVARFGHDWILSTGAEQFEARALRVSAGAPDTTT